MVLKFIQYIIKENQLLLKDSLERSEKSPGTWLQYQKMSRLMN